MIFFTSDLHFYHEKIIHHCNRPFQDAQVMNEKIINNWNSVVRPEDDVFILGDVTMKGPEKAFAVLSRLAGNKFLIKGNHDYFLDDKEWQQYAWVFRWVKDYHELVWKNQKFILFHYPITEWDDYFKGSIHLHGHQHNQKVYNHQQREAKLRRYDVGVDANEYYPVSIHTIIDFFSRI